MKKIVSSIIVVVTSLTMLVGCNNSDKETTKNKETKKVETIRLGVMPSTDNIPFILAHEQGFDTKQGVNIELEVFKSGPDRDAALQGGQVDGVITDLVGIAIYQQGGLDVQIVGVPYDQFDLVTSDESVKTVADLQGKEIAFTNRTGTAYAVAMMLKEAGMTMDDIKVQEIPQVPARLELLSNHNVSAAILPEPFVTMAKAQGHRVLQSTKNIGINPFVVAFTEESLKAKPKAIKGMIDAYNEGSKYVSENEKEKYIQLFIDNVGFPENLKEEIEIPDYGTFAPVDEADILSAFEWSKEAGLLKQDITPKDVMSHVYFK